MEYGDEKSKKFSVMFLKRAEDKLERIDAPGVMIEDVAVIICYTYECSKEEKREGIESPYRKLSKSLSIDRSDTTIRKTRGFLFLLLQSLRKLPRYIPENYVLYRGMVSTSRQRWTQTFRKGSPTLLGMRRCGGHSPPQQRALKLRKASLREPRDSVHPELRGVGLRHLDVLRLPGREGNSP